MQCSAAVRAACRKQQSLAASNGKGVGGDWIVLFSEVTPSEDRVFTILSSIEGLKRVRGYQFLQSGYMYDIHLSLKHISAK